MHHPYKIIKRDGRTEQFDERKVYNAVYQAALANSSLSITAELVAHQVTEYIVKNLNENKSVSNVQKMIEDFLMSNPKTYDIARTYIEYRHDRDKIREGNGKLYNDISGFLEQTAEEFTRENANKPSNVVNTHRDLLAGILSKHVALTQILPKNLSEWHTSGFGHIHDLDYLISPLTNCLGRETAFITKEGTKTFFDFNSGDDVLALTHTGTFKKAKVYNYGYGLLNEITLKRGRLRKTIRATANHRWLLEDGTVTTNLKVGDKLLKTPTTYNRDWATLSNSEKRAWCFGFGYADGVSRITQWGNFFTIPLIGKKQGYQELFEDAGFRVTKTKLYPVVHLGKLEKFLPTTLTHTENEIFCFVDGLIAADGHKKYRPKLNKNIPASIQMTGEEINDFIQTWFEPAGYYLGATLDLSCQETNYGKRNGKTIEYKLNPEQNHMAWTVTEIINTGKEEEVWCLEVEEDASFILSNGVVTGNCCLVNYQDMLENGFHIGNAFIEKPKSIGVATTVLTQIIQAVASSQYGGQTCAHIDTGLKQYVELSYNKNVKLIRNLFGAEVKINAMQLTEQDVYDAMQTLIYQVNTLMSVNGQSPFITISLGLDTSEFGRMITRNYLKIHKEGLGKDKVTPVFPKVIFFLEEGVNMNPGDPNYDLKQLAMECCAERIYPDFISVPRNKLVTKSSKGHVTSMGCRSFLSYFATEQGEKYDGRFNLGVVSLNLPMIAKDSVNSGKLFLEELYKHMQTAYEAHMLRINRLKGTKAKQNPVMFVEGALARLDPEETIDKLFYKGYASASFGYVGLYEAIQILYPNCSLEEYKAYGKKILSLMSEMAETYKKKTGIGFGIYGTPAESLCYKFASKINAKFPGTIEREYLTNSFHVPVDQQVDPFTKWDVESGFDFISSGGNIGYVETPNLKNNMKGLEALIDYGYENIHYFGINQPVDKCLKCGFPGEFKATAEGFECPDCGNTEEGTINVIRRVSGYLSAPNSRPFNKGKMQEVVQRVKHIRV